MKGRNDRGGSSRAVLVGVARVRHEGGGFKKNEITDWVAANWPASNQSLAGWMREYIMYILSPPPYIRGTDASPIQNHISLCARGERER